MIGLCALEHKICFGRANYSDMLGNHKADAVKSFKRVKKSGRHLAAELLLVTQVPNTSRPRRVHSELLIYTESVG